MPKADQGAPVLKKRGVRDIVVRRRATPGAPHLARLHVGDLVIPAAIGKSGLSRAKREGDGATPTGAFRLQKGLFRADRLARIGCALPFRPLSQSMGWSDDANSQRYNLPVVAGVAESHERLWRTDRIYDIVFSTTHNQRPRILGAGSAIFLHLARPGFPGTEGCVAISLADMRRLLPRLSPKARLIIKG